MQSLPWVDILIYLTALCIGRWQNSHNSIAISLFTGNSYNEVLKNLHLSLDDNLDNSGKFAKVRALIEMRNKNCLSNYIPERHVSRDESMVPYYGRHGYKQCMQSKPLKFGYKLWVAAITRGFDIQFYLYAGRDGTCGDNKLGLGSSVVMSLSSKLSSADDANYHLVMDKFFTSPTLLREKMKMKDERDE